MMVMIRKLLFGIFPLLMDESLSSGCILTGQVKWNSDVLTNNDFNYHRLYPSYFRLCLTCCSRINQSNPWRVQIGYTTIHEFTIIFPMKVVIN